MSYKHKEDIIIEDGFKRGNQNFGSYIIDGKVYWYKLHFSLEEFVIRQKADIARRFNNKINTIKNI